ncbi:MBL fold metallo-hydrolase [Pelagibius sp. Alg239-R121]|uniref:MBL fold metallo-hydrolase n=1 Tax=Pelagibius sp. Alg239-R121 TaxID=2993448 RepID=UPI0024A66A6A|nr:MBL fold metallo-hydrolase [Pelagibius sp. Alg239-R121]
MPHPLNPVLVNGRFGDPALYLGFKHEKRALLIDAGDLTSLRASQLRIISDLFISHTHMDHFVGFDHLLKSQLDLDKELRIYGPTGIIDKVGHKLAAYSWNLDAPKSSALRIIVMEINSGDSARRTHFAIQDRFERGNIKRLALDDSRLLEDHDVIVDCALLDHKLPCLAFAIREQASWHIDDSKLAALDLPGGPWLFRLKEALRQQLPPDTSILIDESRGACRLGDLVDAVIVANPGRKICYVTDCQFNDWNAAQIEKLADHADVLFIEAKFAASDSALAHSRYHLTTAQAGRLAASAGAISIEPFHFSRRYRGQERRMLREVESAYHDRKFQRCEQQEVRKERQ